MSGEQERVMTLDTALPETTRQGVLRRLRRLEGQVRGVQRMVEEGRDCQEMLHQIAAVEAAARSLGVVVLEHYVLSCLHERPVGLEPEEARALVRQAVQQLL
jgi:DNA-binding FrmR family transcriptional regulator